MKTAMQELIEELELIKGYKYGGLVIRLIKDRLEKEKEQIEIAFDDVYNEIIEIGCIYDQSIIGINHELEEIKKLILAFYKYNTKRF